MQDKAVILEKWMCKDSKASKLLKQPSKQKKKRKTKPFKEIKREVFERDGWRCQICGTEDDLTVHHIDKDTMITVCKDCHSKIHKKETAVLSPRINT